MFTTAGILQKTCLKKKKKNPAHLECQRAEHHTVHTVLD